MKFLRTLAVFGATVSILNLTACSQTVSLEAAADSNNPTCAEVIVRMPQEIDLQSKRSTSAQATAAWGTPTAAILRCGVPPVAASTLTCITVSDVDWLVDDSKAPSYRFITFGRTPATEVVIDSKKVSGVTVLDELSDSVNRGKVSKRCL